MTMASCLRTRICVHFLCSVWLVVCFSLHSAFVMAAPSAGSKAGAFAQKPLKAETTEQRAARGLLERGQKELEAGNPEQALASFNAAKQLDDSLRASEAIANAMRALGRPADAFRTYSEAVAANRSALSGSALTAAQTKLDEFDAASAHLSLDIAEADVQVELDGVDVGKTPIPTLLANPGPHQLTLKKPGFVTFSQPLLLARGKNAQSFKLERETPTGRLQVSTTSQHATSELLVDNRVVGLLPWEGALPVGKVTLIGRNNDETSAPEQVSVERDVTKAVVLELRPNTGTVDVSTLAPGVRISLDGARVGIQTFRASVPVGRHRLKLERDGFVTQEEEIDVRVNETSRFVIGWWLPLPVRPSPEPDDRGLYFRLELAFLLSNKTDGITQHCEEQSSNAHCSTHVPFGGSLGLRAGYRFKWVAPELGVWALSLRSIPRPVSSHRSAPTVTFTAPRGAKTTCSSATVGRLGRGFASARPHAVSARRAGSASACSRCLGATRARPKARRTSRAKPRCPQRAATRAASFIPTRPGCCSTAASCSARALAASSTWAS